MLDEERRQIKLACPMRSSEVSSCMPLDGDCFTAVNNKICEALRKAYSMGQTNSHKEWLEALEEVAVNSGVDRKDVRKSISAFLRRQKST